MCSLKYIHIFYLFLSRDVEGNVTPLSSGNASVLACPPKGGARVHRAPALPMQLWSGNWLLAVTRASPLAARANSRTYGRARKARLVTNENPRVGER
eukprot:6179464-Pleurochrysis_carterae.AAC.1